MTLWILLVASTITLLFAAAQVGWLLGHRKGLKEGVDIGYRAGSKTALGFAAVLTGRSDDRPS